MHVNGKTIFYSIIFRYYVFGIWYNVLYLITPIHMSYKKYIMYYTYTYAPTTDFCFCKMSLEL